MKTKLLTILTCTAIVCGLAMQGCVFNVSRNTIAKSSGDVASAGLTEASLNMTDYSGNLNLTGTQDSIIRATANISEMITTGSSESAADQLTVSIIRENGVASVGFSYNANDSRWEQLRLEDLTLTCFSGLNGSAKTESGNITATGINGNLDLKTTSGNISVSSCNGFQTLSATSGNVNATVVGGASAKITSGNIDVIFHPVADSVRLSLETTSGNIKVRVPKTLKADLDLKVTSGKTRAPDDNKSQLNGGNGAIQIKCKATSGNITIEEE
jgi:DUF4097 and DUF4098 domain-containing protein YvlB